MYKYSLVLLVNIFLLSFAHAGGVQLHKMQQDEFEKVRSNIDRVIASDDNKIEIQPYDLKQSFSVLSADQKIGYLVPIKYNSKTYRNTICRLFFLDKSGGIQFVDLFAEKNDGEDIVTACVNVEAVSVRSKGEGAFDYFAIIRTRLANTYRSTGVIVGFDNDRINSSGKLNSCVQRDKEISSIIDLKKRWAQCK